ncbi:MAG TPA: membrane protein insertase YidC [Magnetospirillaceae bacterium]|jgi:YidC/Oxa1 family membrane protein insertase
MFGQNRNTVIAIALSIVIIVAWQFWFTPKHVAPPPQQTASQQAPAPGQTAATPGNAPTAPGGVEAPKTAPAAPTREAVLAAAPRVKIVTPSLEGSISLKGARLDDLTLENYRQTTDPNSPKVTLLEPPVGTGNGAYFADFGWVGDKNAVLPSADTLWTASGDTLTPDKPVTLTWDNGKGLQFKRAYAVDANYMFTITETVENTTDKPVTLFPYARVARWGMPKTVNFTVLHEGGVGVLGDSLKERSYKKLRDDKPYEEKTKSGWLGFTDQYWLTALVPDQGEDVTGRMSWHKEDGLDRYQADWTGGSETAAPGASVTSTSHFFAGAKVLALLDGYADQYKIPLFNRAIDFGWFFFLTKPLFHFLRFIHAHVANFGLAILIFTVCVRGAFFPITARSSRSMNKMKMLQPEIKKLQARYGDDRAKLNQEMMALYKREKANPVSGCLPLVIQIPVFFALYKVLFVTIEMRQAPFWGWIHDLSAPDPTSVFNLFGLIPWEGVIPGVITLPHIGLWPLIMGVTMYLQQKMNPQPPDPVQAKMFMILPVVFTFMLAKFPAGLVIYWSWSNCLSILQQWIIRRRMTPKAR